MVRAEAPFRSRNPQVGLICLPAFRACGGDGKSLPRDLGFGEMVTFSKFDNLRNLSRYCQSLHLPALTFFLCFLFLCINLVNEVCVALRPRWLLGRFASLIPVRLRLPPRSQGHGRPCLPRSHLGRSRELWLSCVENVLMLTRGTFFRVLCVKNVL